MKKVVAIIIMIFGLVLGAGTSTTANAATWHEGTPSVIRKTYFDYMNPKRANSIFKIKITKHTIRMTAGGGSELYKAKYYVIREKWYKLKAIYPLTGKPIYYVIHYLNSHKLVSTK